METEAAVVRTPGGAFALERVVLDDPGPGEVLVRVVGAGMCHTDLQIMAMPAAGGAMLPMILGHEGAGIVEEVGPAVAGLAVGDAVVMSFESCGRCGRCRTGHPAYCDHWAALNVTGRRLDGTTGAQDRSGADVGARFFGQSSFGRHALGTVQNLVKVDGDLPIELLGPLGCGIQTGAGSVMGALGVRSGESLGVFGVGAVGLAAVMAARVVGAASIIAVDLNKDRRELALELGATRAFDGADPDLAKQIRAVVPAGLDYAFDTTGVPSVALTALGCLSNVGFCGTVASAGDLVLTPGSLVMGKKLAFIVEGDVVPQVFIPQMIDLWRQGRLPFDKLIKTYPLDQINQAAADAGAGATVKPVLV